MITSRRHFFTFVIFFFLNFTFSCKGYHHLETASISVPYIKEDLNGQLTSAIIKEFSSSGLFSYHSNNQGRFILHIEFLPSIQESIGYQYERDSNNTRLNKIIPNESRKTLKARVSLYDTVEKISTPSKIIETQVEYDFHFEPFNASSSQEFLGQFNSIDIANYLVISGGYEDLSRKILTFITAQLHIFSEGKSV